MIDQIAKKRVSQIVAEWNKAERAIKLAEMSGVGVVLPAIAELRYAGRKLVEFLSLSLEDNDDSQRAQALLADVLHDITRAKCDAIDAMVARAGADLSEVIETYGSEAFPEVRKDIEVIRAVKSKIAETRANINMRSEIYDQILDGDAERIFQIGDRYSYFATSSGNRARKSWSRSFPAKTSAAIVAAGGVVSAILGLLVALFGI